MRKILLTIIILLVMVQGAQSQPMVPRYTPGLTADGLVYFLPKTEILVAVTATRNTTVPGEFAKYANRYLRATDVAMTKSNKWNVDQVQMAITSRPDTAKAYMIQLRKGALIPACTLSDDGVLLSINAPATKPVAPALKDIKSSATTKLNGRDYFTADMLRAASEQKLAQLTAERIYDIRDTKQQLTSAEQTDAPRSADQLKLILNRLDQEEAALLQLFKGYTETETKTWFFTCSPTQSGQYIVAYLSATDGLVMNANALGAEPIYININNVSQGTNTATTRPLQSSSTPTVQPPLQAVKYNVPAQAVIELIYRGQSLLKNQYPIAQFGKIEYLTEDLQNKKQERHILFNYLTGNIEKIY